MLIFILSSFLYFLKYIYRLKNLSLVFMISSVKSTENEKKSVRLDYEPMDSFSVYYYNYYK